jgi:hypothetical protein
MLEDANRKAEARARAEAARKARRERPPEPWRLGSRIYAGIGVAFTLLAVVMGAHRDVAGRESPLGRSLLSTAALAFVVAVSTWLSRLRIETSFDPRAPSAPPWPRVNPGWVVVGVLHWFLIWLIGDEGFRFAATIGYSFAAAVGLGLLVWMIVRRRGMLRFVRLLLCREGWIEGRVEAPGTVVERTVRYEGNEWHLIEGHPSSSKVTPFRVRTGAEAVEVFAEHPLWGATVEYQPLPDELRSIPLFYVTRAAIEPGDSILVCGRTSREGGKTEIRETGPESVLLFAARDRARLTLARMMVGWFGLVALLAALTAVNGWLAVAPWWMSAP